MTSGGGASFPQTPVTLRRVVDPQRLCRYNPCDHVHILGSFWPNSRTSFESHVAKGFKDCNPTQSFEPHITHLCRFYSNLIHKAVGNESITAVARVLSSAEREIEPGRPQSLLVSVLCREFGARDISTQFFKSESRPSMRTVKRLSGPDALEERMQHLVQDLFIRPGKLGGQVLLLDDIYNTSASARVYAWALKEYAGAERVISVNLAATRFSQGRDGLGMLKLDVSGFDGYEGLQRVWLDGSGFYHLSENCGALAQPATAEMRFIAAKNDNPCPSCVPIPARKWWQVFKRGK